MTVQRMKVATALASALGIAGASLLTAPASCQPAPSPAPPADYFERITVTGTHIPAIAGETGLPVQVITREDIERANLQTTSQVVNTVSATMSFAGYNETQGIGASRTPGFAGASLRGLGYPATLILLNSHRIANYPFTTIGSDLNYIPTSAIERVEVLKDGASAIYGSDAIAGVINFILRKDYRGGEVSAQYTSPDHTGGYAKHFNLTAGYGNLGAQQINAYAMVDYQKYGGIQARDRTFAASSYYPAEGFDRTSISSFPANVDTPSGVRNPTGDPGNGYVNPSCSPPLSFPTPGSANRQCRYDPQSSASIYDPNERVAFVGAFTWRPDTDSEFFLNGTYARNKFTFAVSPPPVSNQVTLQGVNHFLLPPTSPYYPHDFARAFGIDGKPLNVYWRALELGPRTIEPTSEQWNVLAGMQGTAKGWDYNGAFNYSQSAVDSQYTDGFVRESALIPILNSGAINPFGPNTQAAVDLMSTAKIDGTLRTGMTSTTSFDFHASNEIYALPAGPLAFVAGFETRRETATQKSDPALEAGDVLNVSSFPSFSGSRNILALFAEAKVPLFKSFEADLAVRYDHYSDFGGTTNPKVSLRWEPDPSLLLRASAGTGFFAPSLQGLFQPPLWGVTTGGNLSDGARCPVTHSPQDCNRAFPALFGGNPLLQPATSSQWSVGAAWAPLRGLSLGADYVAILLDNRVNFFSGQQIFARCPDGVNGPTCYLIHRGAADPNYPTLPGAIVGVDQFLTNLGKLKVTAIDFNIQYKAPKQEWGQVRAQFTGTYTIQNLSQQLDGSYINEVNHYSTTGGNPGTIPYWHHYLQLDWDYGPWSVTVTENFQTGAYDQSPNPNSGGQLRVIGDYDIWNVSGNYAGFRNLTLSAGIKNLLDHNPPFSNQTQNAPVGYDPSYTDVHGRLYWLGLKYAFN